MSVRVGGSPVSGREGDNPALAREKVTWSRPALPQQQEKVGGEEVGGGGVSTMATARVAGRLGDDCGRK